MLGIIDINFLEKKINLVITYTNRWGINYFSSTYHGLCDSQHPHTGKALFFLGVEQKG